MHILHWFIGDFTVGLIVGILCQRNWFAKKKLPEPLQGKPKVLYPQDDAPECLKEAFWAGCASDYLDASVPRKHWTNACKAYVKE